MSYHDQGGFAPIELKDGEDETALVTKALDDLRGSLDARLAEIERKASERLTGRLDKIEARMNRPVTGEPAPEVSIERKAFERYLRVSEGRMTAEELKALTVANDAAGGYLSPDQFGAELIKLLRQYSPVRSYARVVSIGGDSIKYPRRVSSTSASWVSETGTRTASEPAFEQITLTPYELATYTDISNQLLEDNAYNLEAELSADVAESFGKAEGAAFIFGDGNGKPKGLLAATGITTVVTGAASAFPSSNPADVIIGMFHRLPSVHAQNGTWLMNRNTLGMMRTWKDGTGRYLLVDPVSAGMPTTLLGRPIAEMIDMPDVGAGAFPIMFGDMQGYRIIDRIGLSALRDPFTQAVVGQTRFHVRKRVGADVTHPDRFVKLKVAAS